MTGRRPYCGPIRSRSIIGALLGFALISSPSISAFALEEAPRIPGALAVDTSVETAALEPARSVILERQRLQTEKQLQTVSADATLTRETLAALESEIEILQNDRDAIRKAMIEAAGRQREASARLADLEDRIGALSSQEGALKASLNERRGVLAEVLAALQRMGRKPPPALLVKPEDALGSVRSAILLGAVVPNLRDETRLLLADLGRIRTVQAEISTQMQSFGEELSAHRAEEERLKRLSARKAQLEGQNLALRSAAKRRADELAAEADDLKGLISALDADVKTARRLEQAALAAAEKARAEAARRAREREIAAAQAAKEAEKAARLAQDERAEEERAAALAAAEAAKAEQDAAIAAAALAQAEAEADAEAARIAAVKDGSAGTTDAASKEAQVTQAPAGADESEAGIAVAALAPKAPTPPERAAAPSYDIEALRRSVRFLEPSAPFSTLKGRLNPPVAGRRLVAFGERDDIGRHATGASYASRSGDVVTAPADAKVLYSGPFRSYGEVLILDAGDDYHIVLAGMDRIDVETGQFVSAGEPIAAMGSRRVASASSADFDTGGHALYVEFRNNGRPVDPSAWWAD
ncbi:peptidoglycan DD-metalloendopeptidase family protein [Fulvimarina sp. 2208YS6-2-32]|uniref:Peptidoglycan DD-metalloendopeptidase family protein n=1 Tax=Fulvimarina uroteuthidis TaxID=3098149 RepID=A0ABU5I5T3_9HYPH|nr:peptidoglycan DD-metalloendopeptidase family protein [Fulvimarina sp. 2208YS6-2-32]MDY8110108.1 peptidoglycan DD-metalloendopeptidase family protein [Fulvimarina sp. 2208YS6-2-32]